MKAQYKIASMVALVFFISGCSSLKTSVSLNDLVPGLSKDIVGKWKFKDPSAGPHVVTFRKDQTYDVDLNGDGAKDVWGEYTVYIDRIKFTDKGGQIGPTCHDSGYYNYKVQGDEVHFTFLGDQCVERVKALSAVWVRVQNKK